MGKILVYGSHKGGPGKSTNAWSTAVYLIKKGKTCCILEVDDQHSLKDAVDTRKENGHSPDIPYYECYTDIPERARKLAEKYDYVILDTPGRKSAEFRKALVCADYFLSFIEPGSNIEINTLGHLVHDVKTAQAGLNPNMKAWIVLNKCPTDPRDTEASELRKMLNDDPDWLPVPRQRIYYRKAHKQAYNAGLGVHEYNDKQGNKARGELELLLSEIGII